MNPNDNLPSTKTGWLTKQGGSRKNWRKRYFVLKNHELSYYEKEMDFSELKKATPLGVINLAHTSIKQTLPKEVSKKNCFKIEHPLSRTYFCSASNENQMNEWISVLTQTINYIQATIPKHEEKNDWLTKQGGKHKSWKKRYFMLKYNTLYYFNSQSQLDKPLGQINLVNASIIMTDYTINIPNSFAILSKNRRTYIMYANSAQERDEWITSIRQARICFISSDEDITKITNTKTEEFAKIIESKISTDKIIEISREWAKKRPLGLCDFEDFLDIMKDLSFKSDTNNLQNFFGKFDFQGTRTIDHHPLFIGAILFNNNLDPKQKLNIVFNLYDLNGTGNIDFKELVSIFCSFDQALIDPTEDQQQQQNQKKKSEKKMGNETFDSTETISLFATDNACELFKQTHKDPNKDKITENEFVSRLLFFHFGISSRLKIGHFLKTQK